MYRLIYFDPEAGYKTLDAESDSEILVGKSMLVENKMQIICMVDYFRQSIRSKSEDFVSHSDGIDDIIFDPTLVNQY